MKMLHTINRCLAMLVAYALSDLTSVISQQFPSSFNSIRGFLTSELPRATLIIGNLYIITLCWLYAHPALKNLIHDDD